MEEALVFFDFSPGAKYRQNAEQTGQHYHQQRQTVNRQVDRNAETWDPRQDKLRLPLRNARRLGQGVATLQPELQTKRERQSHGDQRDPARHLHAKAFSLPAQEAADEGN